MGSAGYIISSDQSYTNISFTRISVKAYNDNKIFLITMMMILTELTYPERLLVIRHYVALHIFDLI